MFVNLQLAHLIDEGLIPVSNGLRAFPVDFRHALLLSRTHRKSSLYKSPDLGIQMPGKPQGDKIHFNKLNKPMSSVNTLLGDLLLH